MYHLANGDMPFGGVGQSGYGRYHGIEGFKQFSNTKGVMHKAPLNVFPYGYAFPPYNLKMQLVIKSLQAIRTLGSENIFRKILYAPY
jgi:hypothetical protein